MNHPSQTSLGRFMQLNVQDWFGRDGSSTGPWGKYQDIDESLALKNLDRPVQGHVLELRREVLRHRHCNVAIQSKN